MSKLFIPPPDWVCAMRKHVDLVKVAKLGAFLKKERSEHVVFPPKDLVFKALELTPLSKVRVVIVGHRCYMGLIC